MDNVYDLATARAKKEEAATKAALQSLIADLDREVAYKPTAEDKYFELRMRDAVFDSLKLRDLIDPFHLNTKTSTLTFVIEVEDPEMLVASDMFFDLAEKISQHITIPIGYLHSLMIARQNAEWSVMIRYYAADMGKLKGV